MFQYLHGIRQIKERVMKKANSFKRRILTMGLAVVLLTGSIPANVYAESLTDPESLIVISEGMKESVASSSVDVIGAETPGTESEDETERLSVGEQDAEVISDGDAVSVAPEDGLTADEAVSDPEEVLLEEDLYADDVELLGSLAPNADLLSSTGDIFTQCIPTAEDDEAHLDGKDVRFNNMEWYIIEDNSTGIGEGTVTLLAKDAIAESNFSYSTDNYGSATVKSYLDGLTTGSGSFAGVAGVIADTDLSDVGVTGAKLYLLSKSEAEQLPSNILKCGKLSDTGSQNWWLRSKFETGGNSVNGIDGSIINTAIGKDIKQLVRPVLRLDLSKVGFSFNNMTFSTVDTSIYCYFDLICGANTTSSGATIQVVLYGSEITPVIVTADQGYYFEPFEDFTYRGITVTRTNETTVTLSGKPLSYVSITVPDAVLNLNTYTKLIPKADDNTDTLATKQVTFGGIKWYIIEDNSSNASGGSLTLFPVECIGDGSVFKTQWKAETKYSTSDVKKVVDAMTKEGGILADVAGAINTVNLNTKVYNTDKVFDTVSNVKCYLLDVETAEKLPNNIRKCKTASNDYWWLRSPHFAIAQEAYIECEYVYGSSGEIELGEHTNNGITQGGVRPALQLDLSAVNFNPGSKEFTLKPASEITSAPAAKSLTFTGIAQELVSAGAATGGTLKYALGDADGPTESYTTSIPKGTDAGTYYVWYKAFGDDDHIDTAAVKVQVSIGKTAAVSIDDIAFNKGYTAMSITASLAGVMPADAGTLTYTAGTAAITKVSESTTAVSDFAVSSTGAVTAAIATGTAGDVITLPVTINSTNYEDSTAKVVITLKAKDETTITVRGGNTIEKTYGDAGFTIQASVPSEAGSGTWKWTSNDASVATVTDAGAVSIKGAGSAIITVSFESETAFDEVLINLTVNKKDVTITGVSVSDKEYDGGTSAVVLNPGIVNGALTGDDVSAVAGTAVFADKNAGSRAVSFSGFTLGGTKAGNYNLTSQPADTTAMITTKGLTVNVSAVNRAYERGNVTVGLTGGTLTGVIAGDDVSVDTASMTGKMADANTGTGKPVTVTGLTLTGADAGNYSLTQPVGVTVNISKATLAAPSETTRTYPYKEEAKDSVDLSALVPEDAGTVTYKAPVASGDISYKETPAVSGSTLSYTLNAGSGDKSGTITVTAQMQNYNDAALKVNIKQISLALYEKIDKKTYEVRSSKNLNAGKSFTLVPMLADGTVLNKGVVWSSSNPNAATVTQDGKVTGLSGGETIITVRSEEKPSLSAYCYVTVTEPVTEITLDKKSYSFGAGETTVLNATVLPFTAIQELKWTSDNENVVIAVSKDTLSATVTGKTAGKAKITATATDGSGKKATCSFTIGTAVPDFTIAGKNNISTVTAGKTLNMIVNWGGTKPSNAGVTWELTGTNANYIASITDKGVLTGITAGKVTVTAISKANPNKKASAEITVSKPAESKKAKVTGITFTNKDNLVSKGLNAGKSYTIKTKLTLDGKGSADSHAVAWVTSDPSVATVNQKGTVKAVAPGTVTITAITRDAADISTAPKATVEFRVYSMVKSVKLDKKKLTIGTHAGTKYGKVSIASVVPVFATDPSMDWTVNNKNVALAAIPKDGYPSAGNFASAGSGITTRAGEAVAIMALTPGNVKLTGITKDGSKKKVTCTITIRGEVTGLTLKTQSGKNGINDVTLSGSASGKTVAYKSTMKKNSSLKLNPVFEINGVANTQSTKKTYNAYRKYTDLSVSYRSSDTSVATVDKSGKIKIQKQAESGKTVTIYGVTADGQRSVEVLVTVK